MDPNAHQRIASQIVRAVATSLRVGILGSSTFENSESEAACHEIGRLLRAIPDLTVITGGVAGVGATISRSFLEGRDTREDPDRVIHLIPPGYPRRERGQHVVVGTTMIDRREILSRVAPVYICVEGGPGTEFEAHVALEQGAILIPVGRFGGVAKDLHSQLERPAFADVRLWSHLADETAEPATVAAATNSLTVAALRIST